MRFSEAQLYGGEWAGDFRKSLLLMLRGLKVRDVKVAKDVGTDC